MKKHHVFLQVLLMGTISLGVVSCSKNPLFGTYKLAKGGPKAFLEITDKDVFIADARGGAESCTYKLNGNKLDIYSSRETTHWTYEIRNGELHDASGYSDAYWVKDGGEEAAAVIRSARASASNVKEKLDNLNENSLKTAISNAIKGCGLRCFTNAIRVNSGDNLQSVNVSLGDYELNPAEHSATTKCNLNFALAPDNSTAPHLETGLGTVSLIQQSNGKWLLQNVKIKSNGGSDIIITPVTL